MEGRNHLSFETYAQIQSQPLEWRPFVLDISVRQCCAGGSGGSKIIHFVVAIGSASNLASRIASERFVPVHKYVRAARIAQVHVIDVLLVTPAGFELVLTGEMQEFTAVKLKVSAGS